MPELELVFWNNVQLHTPLRHMIDADHHVHLLLDVGVLSGVGIDINLNVGNCQPLRAAAIIQAF